MHSVRLQPRRRPRRRPPVVVARSVPFLATVRRKNAALKARRAREGGPRIWAARPRHVEQQKRGSAGTEKPKDPREDGARAPDTAEHTHSRGAHNAIFSDFGENGLKGRRRSRLLLVFWTLRSPLSAPLEGPAGGSAPTKGARRGAEPVQSTSQPPRGVVVATGPKRGPGEDVEGRHGGGNGCIHV